MKRTRTFIAVNLSNDDGKAARGRLVALQESLARAGGDAKWVEPDNLHLTLLFLGEVGERDLVEVCRTVTTCCRRHEPFSLTLQGAGAFPNARRPRIVWAGVGEGADEVSALHDDLEAALEELGCYRREDRPYAPHITLGRAATDATDALAAALTRKANWDGGSIAVGEVHVMGSELTPGGPVYTVLSRGRLGEPG